MKTDEKSPQVFMFYGVIEIIIKKGILRIFTIIGTFYIVLHMVWELLNELFNGY